MLNLKARIKNFLNYPTSRKHRAIKPEIDLLISQLKNFSRMVYITPYAHNKIAYEVTADWWSIERLVNLVEYLNEDHFEVINKFLLLLGSDPKYLQELFEHGRRGEFVFHGDKYDHNLEDYITYMMIPRHRVLNWTGDCLPTPAIDFLREDVNNLATLPCSTLSEELIRDYARYRIPDNIRQQLYKPHTWTHAELDDQTQSGLTFREQYESDWPIPEDEENP
jgi:hypothetical protein